MRCSTRQVLVLLTCQAPVSDIALKTSFKWTCHAPPGFQTVQIDPSLWKVSLLLFSCGVPSWTVGLYGVLPTVTTFFGEISSLRTSFWQMFNGNMLLLSLYRIVQVKNKTKWYKLNPKTVEAPRMEEVSVEKRKLSNRVLMLRDGLMRNFSWSWQPDKSNPALTEKHTQSFPYLIYYRHSLQNQRTATTNQGHGSRKGWDNIHPLIFRLIFKRIAQSKRNITWFSSKTSNVDGPPRHVWCLKFNSAFLHWRLM